MAGRRDALIARRRAVGHTQESLADVLDVERSTVVRWELGTSRPQPWRRRELAAALSVTLDELDGLLTVSTVETSRADVAHRRDPAEGGRPVLRREFLGATAGLGLGMAAAHPSQLNAGRRVGEHLPDQLRRRTARLRRLDEYLGGADTYELYTAELNATSALVNNACYSERTGSALLSVVAEQAQLAGWAAFDAGWQAEATRLYTKSQSAAEQAGDGALEANALAFVAYQRVSTSGCGVDTAVASCEAAGRDVSPTVHALLWERRAWAHAVAGQPQDTERSLAAAEEALGRDADSPPPDWVFWVDRTELQIMAGRCWAELGRPMRAVPLLESALAGFDNTQARDKALYLTWLAGAYLDASEVEQAAVVTLRALELSTDVASVRLRPRIDILLRRLQPYRALSSVTDLLDRAIALNHV